MVGLDAAGAVGVGDLELADGPLVLVVGSEGRGLSRLVAQRCDVLVQIPMAAAAESLNAGVAAGIALHEVARRRGCLRLSRPRAATEPAIWRIVPASRYRAHCEHARWGHRGRRRRRAGRRLGAGLPARPVRAPGAARISSSRSTGAWP